MIELFCYDFSTHELYKETFSWFVYSKLILYIGFWNWFVFMLSVCSGNVALFSCQPLDKHILVCSDYDNFRTVLTEALINETL